jgi:outer membrane protein assembly factor BamA
MEAEVVEGQKFKIGEITFVGNHAFGAKKLREQFTVKKGDLVSRDKVVSGLNELRKFYSADGFLDLKSEADDRGSSDGIFLLNVLMTEGPQYHMGKLEIVAEKSLAERLQLAWKLNEGAIYDGTYIDKYIQENHDLLPDGFGRDRVQLAKDCPEAVIAVRLKIDDKETAAPMKDVPCEKTQDKTKQ